MRTIKSIAVATVLVAVGVLAAAAIGAGHPSGTVTHRAVSDVEGRIVAIDRSARTFTVRDREHGALTVRVTSATRFERISGFAALRTGERVDVHARQVGGVWNAVVVELSAPAAHAHGGGRAPAQHGSQHHGDRHGAAGGCDHGASGED